MGRKEDLYKWIKIAGFASFIPFILIAGPLTGYFIGDYLEKKFSWDKNISFIFIIIGLVASLFEVVRIIKAMIKAEASAK